MNGWAIISTKGIAIPASLVLGGLVLIGLVFAQPGANPQPWLPWPDVGPTTHPGQTCESRVIQDGPCCDEPRLVCTSGGADCAGVQTNYKTL